MPICSPGCAKKPVAYGQGACRTITRPGGIYKFLFLQCDATIPEMTATAIGEAIESGVLVASGKIVGSQARGTTTRIRTSSCDPERATGRTEQLNFRDYNADNTEFGEVDFWNDKFENQDAFLLGFTTCDELLYGFYENFSIDLGPERPETSLEPAFISGTIEVQGLRMIKPVKIVGINAVLQANPVSASSPS